MADTFITLPAEIATAYNPVLAVLDSGNLVLYYTGDEGRQNTVTLSREQFDGKTEYEIQAFLQSILGTGDDETLRTGAGIVAPVVPAALSKEYGLGTGQAFVAVNASIRKGEAAANDLEQVGQDAALTERPRIPDGYGSRIKVPVYEGYPSGICVQRKALYFEAIEFSVEGFPRYICEGGSAAVTVKSNVPWTAETGRNVRLSQSSGEAGETVVTVTPLSEGSAAVTFVDVKGNEYPYEAVVPYLEVEPSELEFSSDPDDTEREVHISTNLDLSELNVIPEFGFTAVRDKRLVTVTRTETGAFSQYLHINNQDSQSGEYCQLAVAVHVTAEAVSEVLYWELESLDFPADGSDNPQTVRLHYNYSGVRVIFDSDDFSMELLSDSGSVRDYRFTRTNYSIGGEALSTFARATGLMTEVILGVTGEALPAETLYWKPESLDFPADGSDNPQTARLYHNYEYTLEIPSDVEGKFELTLVKDEDGVAEYTVERLDYDSGELACHITAVGQTEEAGLRLSGEAPAEEFYWDPASLEISGLATQATARLVAPDNIAWSIVVEVSDDIRISGTSGMGSTDITFTRLGTAAVQEFNVYAVLRSAEEKYAILKLTIGAYEGYIEWSSHETLKFTELGQSLDVYVKSNVAWSLMAQPLGLSVTPSYGGKSGIMSTSLVTVTCTDASTDRSGTLRVYDDNMPDAVYDDLAYEVTAEETGNPEIDFTGGTYFSIDELATDGAETKQVEIPLKANDYCYGVRLTSSEWQGDTGGAWGFVSLNLGNQSLRADGTMTLDPGGTYTLQASLICYATGAANTYGHYYGFSGQIRAYPVNKNGVVSTSFTVIYIDTTNADSGPIIG